MRRIIALILALALFTVMFVGCTQKPIQEESKSEAKMNEEEKTDEPKEMEPVALKVSSPGGPLAVSLVKMFKEKPSLGENVEVSYEAVKSPDVMAAQIIKGEADFAVIPTNLVAKLHNKGVPYKLAASTVWGVLYVASSEEIEGWESLKGKEIYTIGRGLTPDILLRYLLTKNGLDPEKDVTIKYLAGPQELSGFMITGKASIAVVPEPMLSAVLMKNKDVKVVLDVQEEWEKITGNSSYPQSSLIVKNELIENHPEIVEKFLTKYEESIAWVNENPAEAGKYVEELEIGLKAVLAQKAIPGSNLKYVDASEARDAIEEFLKVLVDFSAESIGGELPKDELYFQR
ncbi:ABC transporter substrate-binding protein [Wukongibacter sp. M2B1]|uniref:ABC transporter substrate-binding protein n=1 Tax=Wukongibacter sp. M2B1 TaxID=3088895 RepID=UPI003D791F6A